MSMLRLSWTRLALQKQLTARNITHSALPPHRPRYYSSDSPIPPLPQNHEVEPAEKEDLHDESPLDEDSMKLEMYKRDEGSSDYGNLDDYYFGPDLGYPNLMDPIPGIDSHVDTVISRPEDGPYKVKITVREDPRTSSEDQTDENNKKSKENNEAEDEEDAEYSLRHLPLNRTELSKLHKYALILRRVTQQTGKGRIHRMASLVVVGNGNGLVGYGQGKGETAVRAMDQGYAKAVRNMDYVNRFEQRTLWTEMDTKLGGTRVYLRPRPLGFGLRCNPNIHQIMKAAGIKDISAKVWGSRNPLNVIQATFRMLQAGSAPLGMGDGLGGPGRTLSKGSGARSKDEIERERGRKMFERNTY